MSVRCPVLHEAPPPLLLHGNRGHEAGSQCAGRACCSASLSAPARICFFPRMPDDADEAPALEAEARLFTRYLVGRPPPAELVDRYRAANAEVLAIDGGTP